MGAGGALVSKTKVYISNSVGSLTGLEGDRLAKTADAWYDKKQGHLHTKCVFCNVKIILRGQGKVP